MSIRKKYIIIILFAATMDWAWWVGGQFFNALMVVPGWSAHVPESIRIYQQNILSHISAYFFIVVNPVFLLPLVIIAWILCLKYKTSFSKWFGVAALLDLIITLTVGLWMAPTAQGIFAAASSGSIFSARMLSDLNTWKIANGIRIGFGIITLFLFLMSILEFRLVNVPENKIKSTRPGKTANQTFNHININSQ
jgi:hypothetical protein